MSSRLRAKVFDLIEAERQRQDSLWGVQRYDLTNRGIDFSSTCRKAQELCDEATENGTLAWDHILIEEFWETMVAFNGSKSDAKTELTQLAAVAVAILEHMEEE